VAHVVGELADHHVEILRGHLDDCVMCRHLLLVLARGSTPPTKRAELAATMFALKAVREQPADAAAATLPIRAPRDVEPIARGPLIQADYGDLLEVDRRHFVVGQEIARGGMGRIIAARDRRLGRPVAIKELLVDSGELRARFEREVRITAKLQHPAIVSLLEAGAWPSGEPFYVMKLVKGDSFADVIANRLTLDSRLALLPNVIAATDALAYAHSMSVIHRDLKPANVLVGEFGETVVIDWGLAKDLSDTSNEAVELPSRNVAAETVVGSVMGTPAYMPLEQAEGDAVDERADVYALGAMLYHVLAGAPPYTGKTSAAVVAAVIEGPPLPVNTRVSGVPRELVTIVNKAMARAREDRYPNARGLADDLKKFQTGQLVSAHDYTTWQLVRRRIRRHRGPIAVAGAALMVLVMVGIVSLRSIVREQARTHDALQLAERNRHHAEDLTSFMLVDMRDRLQPLGKLELLDAVAQKAVSYYESRTETLDVKGEQVLARKSLGDVLLAQGLAAKALTEYRAASVAAVRRAVQDPFDPQRQADLASSRVKEGDAIVLLGDLGGALAAYRASLAICAALVERDQANATWQMRLAESHAKIGDTLRRQGDSAGALAAYRSALAIHEMLVTQQPTNAKQLIELSHSHDRIGAVLVRSGSAVEALKQFRMSLAITEALVATDAANADLKRDLSISYERIGGVLLGQGKRADAIAELEKALRIREALAANDPTNIGRMRDVWVSHIRFGDLFAPSDAKNRALENYRAALVIAKAMVVKDPTRADAKRDLAISHEKVGMVLAAQGDMTTAIAEYRMARDLEEQLVRGDPTNSDVLWLLAINHANVGDVYFSQKASSSARAEYEQARDLASQLVAKDTTNADKHRLLSTNHGKVGDTLLAQGDRVGALTQYRAALMIAEKLAAKDPTNIDLQSQLASERRNVGDVLCAQGARADGLAHYSAALVLAKQVLAADPNDTSRDLVNTLSTTPERRCTSKQRS
jgi:tetratricopeptide (TPR) repeat protein